MNDLDKIVYNDESVFENNHLLSWNKNGGHNCEDKVYNSVDVSNEFQDKKNFGNNCSDR